MKLPSDDALQCRTRRCYAVHLTAKDNMISGLFKERQACQCSRARRYQAVRSDEVTVVDLTRVSKKQEKGQNSPTDL